MEGLYVGLLIGFFIGFGLWWGLEIIEETSWTFTAAVPTLPIPGDEYCDKFHGDAPVTRMYAERLWCEYDKWDNGWHFNRTGMLESLKETR